VVDRMLFLMVVPSLVVVLTPSTISLLLLIIPPPIILLLVPNFTPAIVFMVLSYITKPSTSGCWMDGQMKLLTEDGGGAKLYT